MSLEVRSFEVYGFTIEVHAGGRRVWPPSFKRFVKEGLDSGKLARKRCIWGPKERLRCAPISAKIPQNNWRSQYGTISKII